MKKPLSLFVISLCIFLMIFSLTACDNKEPEPTPTPTPDVVDDVTVIKTILGIDENLGPYFPLNIEKIEVTSDGNAILYPENELKDNVGETYTVKGNIKDAYVLGFGNGGYRCVIFINTDGSLSILSPSALIEHNTIECIDDIGGLSNIVTVTQTYADDGVPTITAEDSSSNTYLLDQYIY